MVRRPPWRYGPVRLSGWGLSYLECPHQVGGVGCLVGQGAGVVVDLVCFVLRVVQQFLQLGHVLPGFAQVEGTEILVERVID